MTNALNLFVYGTLKRGYAHPMARHLAAHADWLGAATCRGRLYRIDCYPGFIPSSHANDIVHGDLYALQDDALLTTLDDYEGCGVGDPQPHPYARMRIDVTMTNGTTRRAWTYVYLLPIIESSRIADGRFA